MNRRLLSVILVLLVVALAVTGCAMLLPQDNFTGERIRNPERYFLDFSSMTGEDEAILKVGDGDSLRCVWTIEKGRVDIEVQKVGGGLGYRGNDIDTADFLLSSLEEGEYRVNVKARRAKGTIEVFLVTK